MTDTPPAPNLALAARELDDAATFMLDGAIELEQAARSLKREKEASTSDTAMQTETMDPDKTESHVHMDYAAGAFNFAAVRFAAAAAALAPPPEKQD